MKICIVKKEPGRQAEIAYIDNGLEGMQSVVKIGSFDMIEHIPDDSLPAGMDLWANEEGKYAVDEQGHYAEPNVKIFRGQDFVMGPVFICCVDDEGESIGIPIERTHEAINWLESHRVSIIEAATARAFAAQFR